MSTPEQQPGGGGIAAPSFDSQIRTYITPRLLHTTYVIALVLIVLQGSAWFLAMAARDGIYVLVAVTVVPLTTIVLLLIARILVEAITVLYRIGEDSARIADAVAGPRATE